MDRITYIVVGVCIVLLLFWFTQSGSPPEPRPPADTSAVESEESSPPESDSQPGAESPDKAEKIKPSPTTADSSIEFDAFPREEGYSPAELKWIRDAADLDDARVELKLDNDSGGIVKARLRQYFEYADGNEVSDEFVDLGHLRFPLATFVRSSEVIEREAELHNERSFSLSTRLDNGLVVVEKWRFNKDSEYLLDYQVELRNESEESQEVPRMLITAGGMRPDRGGQGGFRMQRVGITNLGVDFMPIDEEHSVSYSMGDIEELTEEDKEKLAGTATEWLAVHNKYFLFFLRSRESSFSGLTMGRVERPVPSQGEDEEGVEPWVYSGGLVEGVVLESGQNAQWQFDVYTGPKEFYRIRELDPELTSLLGMDFFFFGRVRWMGYLSSFVLRSLIWLRSLGLSYGLAIIAVTLVIKTLFWPLTQKSAASMRKMQKVQPKIKEIREKYSSDPQAMNKQIMELYREHKVNPLGGCLPMLFQLPVFLALFNTFRSAIELRQSSFLWVADLSQPDTLGFMPFGLPIRPLALMAGGSMMLQLKTSPSSADPNQAKMMMFMSVFFIFISYTMPAGLTLYWTINQLLTIVQHAVLRRMEEAKEVKPASA